MYDKVLMRTSLAHSFRWKGRPLSLGYIPNSWADVSAYKHRRLSYRQELLNGWCLAPADRDFRSTGRIQPCACCLDHSQDIYRWGVL